MSSSYIDMNKIDAAVADMLALMDNPANQKPGTKEVDVQMVKVGGKVNPKVLPSIKATKIPAKKVKVFKVAKVIKVLPLVHPDGSVFYRADRSKWIAMMNGKQEAARETSEKALEFLMKKYQLVGNVIV